MAKDLITETLSPNQRAMARWLRLMLTPTCSMDFGKSSENLRRRHQVEHPGTYDDKFEWVLSQQCVEAEKQLTDALGAKQGEPTTNCACKNDPLMTALEANWRQLTTDGILKSVPFTTALDANCTVMNYLLMAGSKVNQGKRTTNCDFKKYPLMSAVVRLLASQDPVYSSSTSSFELPNLRFSIHARHEDNINQATSEPDQSDTSISDHTAERLTDGNQQPDDQCALVNSESSYYQDIEGLSREALNHPYTACRITVCYALIGVSIVGVAMSLSLALWWSIAHGDPGSGFTIGSYILAAFGVLLGIPGYRHSKTCQCWDGKPKGA